MGRHIYVSFVRQKSVLESFDTVALCQLSVAAKRIEWNIEQWFARRRAQNKMWSLWPQRSLSFLNDLFHKSLLSGFVHGKSSDFDRSPFSFDGGTCFSAKGSDETVWLSCCRKLFFRDSPPIRNRIPVLLPDLISKFVSSLAFRSETLRYRFTTVSI